MTKLNESLHRGRLDLATRLAVPPMATRSAEGGLPTGKTVDRYRAFARNPLVGLVIVEHNYVDLQGKAHDRQLSLATDDAIAAHRAVAEAVHEQRSDVAILAQISHAGFSTSPSVTGQPIVSASALQVEGGVSRALSVDEIAHIEDEFAAAAVRAQRAGYDGVELHAAHGYLFNQFYSPFANKRTDEYGPQTMENRLRFLVETIRAVRAAVGDDFVVSVRFGGCDYREGGSTLSDAAEAARLLDAEDLDLIDVSGGMCGFKRPGTSEPGWFSDLSQAVRGATRVPVMLAGGVKEPDQAERLLDAGAADLIGVGRAMLKDPATWGADNR